MRFPVRPVDHLADGEVGQRPLGGPAQVAPQLGRLPRHGRRGEGPVAVVQALSRQETEEGHLLVVDTLYRGVILQRISHRWSPQLWSLWGSFIIKGHVTVTKEEGDKAS